ncbi:hypothetical protein ASD80_00440 [Devosia sp. Root635]|nr:hypothetical protein ASD80_00440 [Devosia sp. Root635]
MIVEATIVEIYVGTLPAEILSRQQIETQYHAIRKDELRRAFRAGSKYRRTTTQTFQTSR